MPSFESSVTLRLTLVSEESYRRAYLVSVHEQYGYSTFLTVVQGRAERRAERAQREDTELVRRRRTGGYQLSPREKLDPTSS